MRRTRLGLSLLLLVGACTNPAVPTGQTVLLRIELDGTGTVQSVVGQLRPEAPPYAAPRERGELVLEVLEGDAPWRGSAYVSLVAIAEDFQEMAITGSLEPIERQEIYLAFPDDGREAYPIQISLTVDQGSPIVSEHTVTVSRDVGAATGGLTDVGARREALGECGSTDVVCAEPEQFCDGTACRDEACLPDDTWDGTVVELEAGADQTVLFIPLNWTDPDEFEQYTRDLVRALHIGVDWFAENQGRIGFSTWRQACDYGAAPDFSSRSAAFNWLIGLPANTRLLPPADRYVVIANTDTAQGRATSMGTQISVGVYDRITRSASVLAHELGHSVAGLGDEYDYGTQNPCTDPVQPNYAAGETPKWFCDADTGEVYAGQSCGPHGQLVAASGTSAGSCSNVSRPCDSSLMRQTWELAQFDPVAYGAMTYSVDTGERMGFADCGATCDPDCSAYAAGQCGFNDCNQLCDNCDAGDQCGLGVAAAPQCRAGCPAGGDHCRSSLGFEFCDTEIGLTTDPACPGRMLRRVECRDGDMIPIECIDG